MLYQEFLVKLILSYILHRVIIQPMWLKDLQDSYASAAKAQLLLFGLAIQPHQEGFHLVQGKIRKKGKIWLGHNTTM